MWKPKTYQLLYICQHVQLPSKTETLVHNSNHSPACRRSRSGKVSLTKLVESKSSQRNAESKGEPQQTLPGFHLKWEWSRRKAVCVFNVHTIWLALCVCVCVFYWVWTVWTWTTCKVGVHAWPAEDFFWNHSDGELTDWIWFHWWFVVWEWSRSLSTDL